MITEESAPTDTRVVLDTLPIQVQDTESIKDFIEQETTERDSPVVQFVINGLAWIVFAAALGFVGMMAIALLR